MNCPKCGSNKILSEPVGIEEIQNDSLILQTKLFCKDCGHMDVGVALYKKVRESFKYIDVAK